jgi:hypothetical protein
MSKTPDRLYYSKKAKKIVEQIDESKYLGLHNTNTSRLELFLFAMSLGINSSLELENQESFVLAQSIKPEDDALLFATSIGYEEDTTDINKTSEKSYVYDFAQKCANSGFLMIENMIQNENPISVELKLLSELDDLYQKNVQN